MKLPYVIDNQTHVLADILKALLTERKGRSLDVATAYFTVGRFGVVRERLMKMRKIAHIKTVRLRHATNTATVQ